MADYIKLLLCLLIGYWLADWVAIGFLLASHADIVEAPSCISAPRTVVGEDYVRFCVGYYLLIGH